MKIPSLLTVFITLFWALSAHALPADLDGNGLINLGDVTVGLRLLTGKDPGTIQLSGDADGDGRLGLEDTLQALRKVAEAGAGGPGCIAACDRFAATSCGFNAMVTSSACLDGCRDGWLAPVTADCLAASDGSCGGMAVCLGRNQEGNLPQVHVATTGSDASDGATPATPLRTIAAALDRAAAGATIKVATGTYREHLTITKSLNLEGGYNADFTSRNLTPGGRSMLDGAGSRGQEVRIVNMTGRPVVAMSGFSVTRASGERLWADGGGIFVHDAQVSLTDMTIKENVGYQGGGIHASQSALALLRCDLLGNRARGDGGGLFLDQSTVTISESKISANDSEGRGGAIALAASPLAVTDTVITGNGAGAGEGAIAVAATLPRTNPVLTGCTVFSNYPGDPEPTAAAPLAPTDLKGAWEVIFIEADGNGETGVALITADDGQSFSGNAFGNDFTGTRSQDNVTITAVTSQGRITFTGRIEAGLAAMRGTYTYGDATASWLAQRRGSRQGQTVIAAPLEIFDVQVVGGFAYAATATGLVVFDLADPFTPVPVASYETMKSIATAGTIRVSGSRAYLADWDNGLQIFDISTPAKPVLLGTFRTISGYRTVEISGTTAYLGHHWSGLQIVDVADPARPRLLGGFGNGEVFAIALAEKHAYLGMGKEMKIVDISNPAQPVLTGTHIIEGYDFNQITTIGLAGSSALLGDFYSPVGRMALIDIADPAAPEPVATDPELKGKLGLLAGNRGFIAHDNLLQVYDFADPTHPVLLKTFMASGTIRSLVIDKGQVYLACGQAGLQVLAIGEIKGPATLGTASFSWDFGTGSPFADCGRLMVEGERGYMICGPVKNKVGLFDLTDPTAPVPLGEYGTGSDGTIQEFRVRGNTAYLLVGSEFGGAGAFQAITVADPAHPAKTASYQCGDNGSLYEMTVGAEGLAALKCGGGDKEWIELVDLTTPDTLRLAGLVQPDAGSIRKVTLTQSLLLVELESYDEVQNRQRSVLQAYDISHPATPVPKGRIAINLSMADGLGARGALVYLLGYDERSQAALQTIDFTDPLRPELTATVTFDGSGSLVHGDADLSFLAFWGDTGSRLQFLDLSDPRMPALGGVYDLAAELFADPFGNRSFYLSAKGLLVTASDSSSFRLALLDANSLAGAVARGDFRSSRGFSAERLAGEEGRLYVGGVGPDGISSRTMLFDTTDPAAPRPLSFAENLSILGGHNSFSLNNHQFYRDCLFYSVDWSDPLQPKRLWPESWDCNPADVAGGDTFNPVLIAGEGNYVYAVGTDSQYKPRLRVFAVSGPAGPVVLTTLPLPEGTPPILNDMALHGNLLAIAGADYNGKPGGVLFIEVTTPAQPVILGTQIFGPGSFGTLTDVYDPHRLLLSQGRAFVFASRYYGEDSRLFCLDLTNPAMPTLLGELPLSGGGTVVTAGPPGVIFAASEETNGILHLDVTNPVAPRVTSFYQTPGQVRDILYQDGFLYAATDSGGVRAFAISGR